MLHYELFDDLLFSVDANSIINFFILFTFETLTFLHGHGAAHLMIEQPSLYICRKIFSEIRPSSPNGMHQMCVLTHIRLQLNLDTQAVKLENCYFPVAFL